MRQADGSELLGAGDPRAEEIGVIYVAPTDERKDVLTAILTQEKLGRRQIAIVLPEQNRAFQRRVDFEVLKMRRNPQARLIFIAPPRSEPAEYARQRRFAVYSSLESYARSLQDRWAGGTEEEGEAAWPQRLRRLLGLRGRTGGSEGQDRAERGRQRERLSQRPGPAEESAVSPEPEPSQSGPRGSSTGKAAAAGALVGSAAGIGWAALQQERQPADEERPPADLEALEEDEELPPVVGAGRSLPAAARSGAGKSQPVTPPAQEQQQGPEQGEEEQGAPPVSPAEAGAVGGAIGLAAAQSQASRNQGEQEAAQDQEEVKASATPPRTAPGSAGPSIIRFPHSRRITAKLPLATNAYAPNVEAARQGSSSGNGGAGRMAAAAGAGALAGAAAGAAFAGAGTGMSSGGGSSVSGAGAPPVVQPSGVSTLPPPLTPLRQRGARRRRRTPLLLALLVAVLLLLLIGCGTLAAVRPQLLGPVAAMMPFGTPGATVTITPASVDVKNQYLITGVTGQPDPAQRQIQARLLTAAPGAQTKTATATGHGQTPAVSARGTVTFVHYGGTWESVLSGTKFPLANGLAIITDETVSLPPVDSPGQPVSRTGRAHVVPAGSAGNLPAGAISNRLCCGSDSIWATSGAFTGGQDPESYTFVQQSDIDNLATPLKASLAQQAQQQFQRQLRPGEQLVGQPACQTTVKSDHQAGDHASSVTVTVSATCSGEVFDRQAALRLAASLLGQEAGKKLGASYAPVGQPRTTISDATLINARQGVVSITITAEGLWAYQFSAADKERLAHLIAGKSRSEAQQLLQRQEGIKASDIQIAHGSERLPADSKQINIVIATISGLQPGTATSTVPASSPIITPTRPEPGTPGTTGKG
ncbi:hypothetical protein [Thermogemmatispora sp.]|uniref:hypothetical protein n=1 Tax=Thermogemmatispora sp. TaxID=1968838 RepID=UPI0035E3FA06